MELSPSLTKMTAASLRLCLLTFALLQMRNVASIVLPPGRGAVERQQRDLDPDEARTVSRELDALLHLKDSLRGPGTAPQKKAPKFMLDLFNAVSVTDGRPKSQKEILEGNIVRSFEDKGKPQAFNVYLRYLR